MKLKKTVSILLILCLTVLSAPVGFLQEAAAADQLPARYDAREHGLVTAVETQISGTCWAHATVAALESNAILQGLADTSLNLNEYHLAKNTQNGYYEGVTDARNDGYVRSDFAAALRNGSTVEKAGNTLLCFAGAVTEDRVPVTAQNTDELLEEMQTAYTFSNKYSRDVTCAEVINIGTNPEDMKRAVLTYGGLYFAFIYHEAGFSGYAKNGTPVQTYFTKDYVSALGDHAVELIGWDDNFAVENFGADPCPSAPGAWLLKNSKGTGWGTEGGYFWISYEDPGLYSCVAVKAAPADAFEKVFMYDGTLWGERVACSAAANVFTSDDDVFLTKFSVGEPVQGNYTLRVFLLNDGYRDPTDGELLYTQSGTLDGRRYIDITGTVQIYEGERFSVVVEGPAECYAEGAPSETRRFTSNPGESYYYNGSWTDAHAAGKNNVCIRAVARAVKDEEKHTVTFCCPGYYENAVRARGNAVPLPQTEGCTWVLTLNGLPFDGSGVTADITVEAHCYPTQGTVSPTCVCTTQYRCIYCGTAQKADETVHRYGTAPVSNGDGTHSLRCADCGGKSAPANCAWTLVSSTAGADCQQTGTDTYVCSACGQTKTAPNGNYGEHRYSGSKCTVCGKEKSFFAKIIDFFKTVIARITSLFR